MFSTFFKHSRNKNKILEVFKKMKNRQINLYIKYAVTQIKLLNHFFRAKIFFEANLTSLFKEVNMKNHDFMGFWSF